MAILIKKLENTEDVYDITVKDNHNFFANNILVHNCEIDLPTKPLKHLHDPEGEIALCTLAAVNFGLIDNPEDFEEVCDLLVRALNELLDYQDYPVIAAEKSTMGRRPLGVGIIDLAHALAKRGLKYDSSALTYIDEYMQHFSYYLIKSSIQCAKERGAPCPLYNETKYSSGIFPIDTYKKSVDELVEPIEYLDWELLRSELKEHGILNSTLMAIMPAETSAQISNSTNGIEPPRGLISHKKSKDGTMAQVVPGIHKLKNKYDLLWDQNSPEGYLDICAVIQKYVDQGISTNTSYNPKFFPNNKVPMSQLIKDLVRFYKYGGKQLYYNNTHDDSGEIDVDDDCDSGACKI